MHTFYPGCADTGLAASLDPVVVPGERIMEWLFGGHTAELSKNGYVGAPARYDAFDAQAFLSDTAQRIRDAILA